MTMWSTVRTAPMRFMKRRSLTYEAQSRLRAVDAASIMMMGASTISARGNTSPPYAARLIFGSANRDTTALTAGPSKPMSIQLAASGHQVLRMRRAPSAGNCSGSGAGRAASGVGM
jgi:hypothetical protein